MNKNLIYISLLLWQIGALAQGNAGASALTERDFFDDMPIVLSVSRLAQRLDDTPGAVTILDRAYIRMSGARDVVELLRVVPGFQTTTSFETDAPLATYHGRTDDWANRIQVLVDGRSVYSSYLQGSAGMGWQTLAMDDIERVEILRGSNSAAYGARAFLGVVNIVSRDPLDTLGTAGSLSAGGNGVADASARVGWGDPSAVYRISVDTRGDEGLRGTVGKSRIDRVNFTNHRSLGSGDTLDIRAGATNIDAGRGSLDAGEYGNLARMRRMDSRFVQLDWSHSMDVDSDLKFRAAHTEFAQRDSFPYANPEPFFAPYYGISIAFDAVEVNEALTLQQTTRFSSALRTVWGVELRSEQVRSRASFDARREVTSSFSRLFGNAEWRISPALVLNAGMLGEHSDIGGDSVSPRLMLNWHLAAGHTLRGGVSDAFRPPSPFEKYGDVKYYDRQGANPLIYAAMSGKIGPEHIRARELGYYLSLPNSNIGADLRWFHESITDGVYCSSDIPADCSNQDKYTTKGVEYQITWKPRASTQIFWSQTWTQIGGLDIVLPINSNLDRHWVRVMHSAPELAGSLAVMHTFDSGVSLSLVHNRTANVALLSQEDSGQLHSMWRTDLRLAKAFKWGKSNGELALTLQNLDAPYQDGGVSFFFDQRAFVTLRLEN